MLGKSCGLVVYGCGRAGRGWSGEAIGGIGECWGVFQAGVEWSARVLSLAGSCQLRRHPIAGLLRSVCVESFAQNDQVPDNDIVVVFGKTGSVDAVEIASPVAGTIGIDYARLVCAGKDECIETFHDTLSGT